MSYFESPDHSLLPPVVDAMAYSRPHSMLGLANSGSAVAPGGNPRGVSAQLGAAGDGSLGLGYWGRFGVLTGLNFVLLWLFIKEFGIAAILAGILGLVEAAVTG